MLKLRNIRKSEHNRKKRWKIKNANKSFFQNPYRVRTSSTTSVTQISTKETSIISCGQILIVHLSRYLDSGNDVFIKNTDFVECLPETTHVLRVPIQTGDSISFTNQYSLIATIKSFWHFAGWTLLAFIKDRFANNWLNCNDRTVLKVKPHTLNNNTSYVLFYIRN